MELLRDYLGIIDDQGLLEHPKLEFIPLWEQLKGCDPYFENMYAFVTNVSEMLENDRLKASPKYDTTFPLFFDYLQQKTIQFTKEWCKQEGLEWDGDFCET